MCGDGVDELNVTVLVRILVMFDTAVESLAEAVVGVGFGVLAVSVMWIVDVCASPLDQRFQQSVLLPVDRPYYGLRKRAVHSRGVSHIVVVA